MNKKIRKTLEFPAMHLLSYIQLFVNVIGKVYLEEIQMKENRQRKSNRANTGHFKL